MTSTFNPKAPRTFNWTFGVWWIGSVCGRSVAHPELALLPPHAPSESRYRFAFKKARARFHEECYASKAVKRLRQRTTGGQDFGLKATSQVLNPVRKTGSLCVEQSQSTHRLFSYRVTYLSCRAASPLIDDLLKSVIQATDEQKIRAQLPLRWRAIKQQSSHLLGLPARCIQDTIETDRLTEASQLAAAVGQRLRSLLIASHKVIPVQR